MREVTVGHVGSDVMFWLRERMCVCVCDILLTSVKLLLTSVKL